VFDIQLADRTSNLILKISFQQVISLIVAYIISLCQVLVNTTLEFTTNTLCRSYLMRLANIYQKVWIVKVECDMACNGNQISIKNDIVGKPRIRETIKKRACKSCTLEEE